MKLTGSIVAATAAFLAAGSAQALPIAPMGVDAPLVLARGGCGYGEHRGPMAGCRLNNGPRGAIRKALTGAPRGCPPGRTRGPGGLCR